MPMANSFIRASWWCLDSSLPFARGIASLEMSITPSVRVVRARHLRSGRWRPRIMTEKMAVVKTFICATIEKVDASRWPSATKPRMFITR